jgi:hypothetical protein
MRDKQPHPPALPPLTSCYQTSTGEARQPIYNAYLNFRFPNRLEVFEIKDLVIFYEFHNSKSHDTRECITLKDEN